jgi:hypothetical protein
VYATGFHPCFPFIGHEYLSWSKERPQLYMNIFDPQHQNLFFIGLFQTSTGNWPLMDYQAQLVARYIKAREFAPKKAARLTRLIANDRTNANGGIRFTKVSRHAIEVEHFSYRSKLRRLIAGLPGPPAETRDLPLQPAILSLSSGAGGRRR